MARTARFISLASLFMVGITFLAGAVRSTTTAAASQRPIMSPTTHESIGRLPLYFEVNRGQTDREVKFLSRGRDHSVFLTPTETVLILHGTTPGRTQPAVLRMSLTGAAANPVAEGLEPQPGKVHYLIGRDAQKWRRDIPTYARVRFKAVYPGVDLVYYGREGRLEYDFVVAPGADPGQIRLTFTGADRLTVDDGGNLVASVGGGEVVNLQPRIYQEVDGRRQPITGRYRLLGPRTAGFALTAFDSSRPLVIDPQLLYASYLGGSGDDAANVTVDADGYIYVVGTTASSDFPTFAPYQPSLSGAKDAFVAKFDPTGASLVYATYLGGSGTDEGYNGRVDSTGAIAFTGLTNSADFPTVNPYQASLGGGDDVYVAKLAADGSSLLYATYLGGTLTDRPYGGMAMNASGIVAVTGYTASASFPLKNPYQSSGGGCFVTKIDPSQTGASSVIFSTRLGGSSTESVFGTDIDASGNIYVTGRTDSTDFPVLNAYQNFNGGSADAFLCKYNSAGSLSLATYLGGTGFDWGRELVVDASGNIWITGQTASSNFPITAGAYQTTLNGTYDGLLMKFDNSGILLLYSTFIGGAGTDRFEAMTINGAGNIFIGGYSDSSDYPLLDAIQSGMAGVRDAVVSEFDSSGGLVFSTYLGGSAADECWSLAAGPNDWIYAAGWTLSGDFPTVDPYQATFGGGGSTGDGFVFKIGEPVTPPGPVPVTYRITVPAGTTATDYRMVSVPMEVDSPRPTDFLGSQIGPYDTNLMRIGWWNEATQAYYEYPGDNEPCEPGDTGWFLFRNGKTLTLSGTKTPTVTGPMGLVGMAQRILQGWNQIGNPFLEAVAVDQIVVEDYNGDHALLTESANSITQPVFWVYRDGEYLAGTTLGLATGGWVKKLTPGEGWVWFPAAGTVPDADRAESAPADLERPPAPPGALDSSSSSGGGGGGCFIDAARGRY